MMFDSYASPCMYTLDSLNHTVIVVYNSVVGRFQAYKMIQNRKTNSLIASQSELKCWTSC